MASRSACLRVVTCKGDAHAVHPEKHEAIIFRNINTYIQTEPEQKLFEVDFREDSNAIVFSFCWSKRYADSTAIVFCFVFVETLTRIYIYIYIKVVATLTHTYTWSFLYLWA